MRSQKPKQGAAKREVLQKEQAQPTTVSEEQSIIATQQSSPIKVPLLYHSSCQLEESSSSSARGIFTACEPNAKVELTSLASIRAKEQVSNSRQEGRIGQIFKLQAGQESLIGVSSS